MIGQMKAALDNPYRHHQILLQKLAAAKKQRRNLFLLQKQTRSSVRVEGESSMVR